MLIAIAAAAAIAPAPGATPVSAATIVAKQSGQGSYVNARFGTRASYPAGMFGPARESDNGDGVTMTSRDGATLMIYGSHNIEGQTPAEYLAARVRGEGRAVSYRHVGRNSAVMSGTHRGRIFYQRFEFDSDRDIVHSYRLEYPRGLQRRYGPVVRRIRIENGR